MTYVVNDKCIKCKYHGLRRGLSGRLLLRGREHARHPSRTSASIAASASRNARSRRSSPDTEPGLEKWLNVNAEFAKVWPNITIKKEPPADAKEWEDVPEKFEKYFSPNPGSGD